MSQRQFVVYKMEGCPYCTSARGFLDALQAQRADVAVKYIDTRANPGKYRAAEKRSGMSTVPQVFLDGQLVGGWDQLSAVAGSGRLDAYLDTGVWPAPAKRSWWPFGKKEKNRTG